MKKSTLIGLSILSVFILCSLSYQPIIAEKEDMSMQSVDGPMDSPWPMNSHNAKHTGRSPYSTADNNGFELWRFECGWIPGGAVIDNNKIIYFGDENYDFYALYPNGTLKWKYHTNGDITSTPAIAEDGTIYVGSWDFNLYAFNTNGSLKWKFNAGQSISSSPAIAEDGTIYFGVMGPASLGRIYATYPNGTEKWHYDTDFWINSDPAIGYDGAIYIGSGDSYLYAIYPDGELKWRFKTGDEIHSHPSIGLNGTIYFGSNDDFFYALYPSGILKWKYNINGNLYASAIIGEDGSIYVPDHGIFAFYPNGSLKWKFEFGDNRYVSQSSPALSADGILYIGVSIKNMIGGELFAINYDGIELWRRLIANDWVDSSPCIGEEGIIYIGSASSDSDSFYGHLYAFGEGNSPPNKPSMIGPSSGKAGNIYNYTFVTTDPEDDDVSYYVDWGDDNTGGWTRLLPSGEEYNVSHTWEEEGTYEIRVKAKDSYETESEWATLEVSMPKSKIIPFNNISIEIHGGLGLTIIINNNGDTDIQGLEVTLTFDAPWIMLGVESSITTGFLLGFGPFEVTVQVLDIIENRSGFLLGPFVILFPEVI